MDLREVRGKISSVKNITEITAALETFAALKMRKTQKRHNETKPFAQTMARILKRLEKTLSREESIFLEKRDVKNVLVCVIASDRGFCGPFNANVLKFAKKNIEEVRKENLDSKVEIMPIGKKASSFFKKQGEEIKYEYIGVGDYFQYLEAREIADFIIKSFIEKDYDKVYFVYNRFVNSFMQKPTAVELFPLNKSIIDSFVEEENEDTDLDHVLEPDSNRIVNQVVKEFVSYLIYQFILSANTAEHSARMTAMKNASDNASEILSSLKVQFNKARQQQITNEVSEISSTKEAME